MKLGLISTKIRTIAIISTWIFAGVLNVPRSFTLKLVESGNNTYCLIMYPKDAFPNQEAIASGLASSDISIYRSVICDNRFIFCDSDCFEKTE